MLSFVCCDYLGVAVGLLCVWFRCLLVGLGLLGVVFRSVLVFGMWFSCWLFVCLLLAVFVGLGNYAAGLCCFELWFRWLGLVIWYLSWAGCLVY